MKPSKKLLIAGGGYADIPLINAAKKLGFYVVTSGNRQSDLGHLHSDEYYAADFSDPEAILHAAKKHNVDAICPCANDFSAIAAAYAAEKLGLPGHDSYKTSLIIHHKDLYRDFAIKKNIPTPFAKGYHSLDQALQDIDSFLFPLIIKPVDLTGGKGIRRVDSKEETVNALKNAFSISKSKRVVVEEFLDGTRHGFTSLIQDGRVIFNFTDDEYYYLNQYMVAGTTCPSSAPETAISSLTEQTELIAELLQLRAGIFHIQFIMNQGKPYIIEICRRPPGDLYVQFVKYATGIDYPLHIIESFSGMRMTIPIHANTTKYMARHCVMASQNEVFDHIEYDESIRNNIIDKLVLMNNGSKIDDYMKDKLEIVFLQFDGKEEMHKKIDSISTLIQPVYI